VEIPIEPNLGDCGVVDASGVDPANAEAVASISEERASFSARWACSNTLVSHDCKSEGGMATVAAAFVDWD